ncbi:chorismate synthase [Hydrogenobacter thermophilus TK-6]|uniref:Chorismate synthase n=1 Tax=Hydrogenobacter thermophilus (strain DSM 6534 / IAM 12695 / TK-6) TaxID=608538 RepID=D3DFS9_HYDTT|nr:chorismate synthase [Hydrogenobacter thermophilus]ADO44621.1 chorismate synthase [Hydrogenobacter thermophilus TK-6]BAI68681.1 chorismate synthase [Hydrogenobacter thermophilus TK-6]
MPIRFLTAGESHGKAVVCILEGIPANLDISTEYINRELERRQRGYGRGGRMKIEKDSVEILSGVRFGKTLGSPIAMLVQNRDWENWQEKMAIEGKRPEGAVPFTRPRPGHADLVGGIKYNQRDLRNVLERASARETVGRVAVGTVCKRFLEELGIKIGSYVVSIGKCSPPLKEQDLLRRHELAESSSVRFPDPTKDEEFMKVIDEAREKGESLGGIFEVFAVGVPPGLGSHIQWDKRIDGRIAQAILSIHAIKGVEFGLGFEAGRRFGSEVHDEIGWSEKDGYFRYSNHLGGTEGGMTNGMPLLVRAVMKPIPTLTKPLRSVDIETKEEVRAGKERSDVVAVPAASVVAEAMLAIVLADALLEKLGGDFMEEVKERYERYLRHVKSY